MALPCLMYCFRLNNEVQYKFPFMDKFGSMTARKSNLNLERIYFALLETLSVQIRAISTILLRMESFIFDL